MGDRESWDRRWREVSFSPVWWVDGPHEPIRDAVKSGWLPRGCTVLELGCGAGQGAAWLQREGFTVLGVDISLEAIKRARRDFGSTPDLAFDVIDVARPNEVRRKFDALLDAGCFHDIHPATHRGYVNNVIAWSRPGTRFLMVAQCRDYRPADRRRQIERLFGRDFDLDSCELTECLPRAPGLPMMISRLVRRGALHPR